MNAKQTKRWAVIFACMVFCLAAATAGAQNRKIAVAADGGGLKANVSAKTARAPFILIFDREGNFEASLENPVTVDRGAGPQLLAAWLAKNHVDTIIGAAIGPRMGQALAVRQIHGIEKSGRVSDAIKDVLE